MTLDNKKATINFQLRRLLILFLLAAIIVVMYNIYFFSEPFLGISRNIYTIALVILYLLYYLIGIIRNYNYFFYSDNGLKLIFRFYSLRPLSKRQNVVEIEKPIFMTYKIEKPGFGFFKRLYLSQRLSNGSTATYPPISISLLKKSDIKKLEQSLKSFSK
jgi:hypothetical protein